MLLGAGADVNKAKTNNGQTPLFTASWHRHAEVVEMLLGAGADVDKATTDVGATPLLAASWTLNDAAALAMVQLLAMAGANLEQVADDGRTAAMNAADTDKPLAAAWLDSVAALSPVQICVARGNGAGLEALLRRQECDPFARTDGTPALAELAAGNRPLLRLCREVRSKWAPSRHRLFHPAHRSTVVCLLLVARHTSQHRGIGFLWVTDIPTEVWFMVAGQLGRMGWPNGGRDALPLQMPRRA